MAPQEEKEEERTPNLSMASAEISIRIFMVLLLFHESQSSLGCHPDSSALSRHSEDSEEKKWKNTPSVFTVLKRKTQQKKIASPAAII